MEPIELADPAWRDAVAAIDAGDVAALTAVIEAHPALVRDRLEAGDGYFARPYLLWFVAENPVRNDRLPANIDAVARAILDAARRAGAPADPATWAAQLDGALALVATGRVPREQGVQRALIDALAEAGADLDGAMRGALPHRELDAARHLRARGAPETLLVAAALGDPEDVHRLGADADASERHAALMCAAVAGRADTIAALIALGVDVNAQGANGFHSHSTALHQAVDAGDLAAVERLAEAGADLTARDRIYDGTALDWAEHLGRDVITAYLRGR